MRIAKLLLPAILGGILSLPALAQNAPAQAADTTQDSWAKLDVTPFMNAVDTDKDGKVTLAEWTAAGLTESIYSYVDTTNKGYFTKEDFVNSLRNNSQYTSGIDSNGDGKITLDKFKAMLASLGA